MDFENLTTDLQAKVQKAEDIAIEYLKGGLEFAPFIHFGSHKIQKLITASLDQSIDKAIKIIEDLNEQTVILIYRNKINLKDGIFDAIVSQIYDLDEDSAYSFGLLYKLENNNIQFSNKRVFLGDLRNALIF